MTLDTSSDPSRRIGDAAWPVVALRALWRSARLVALWRRRAAARRQLERLRELDDRMLKDIGLTRFEVHRETPRSFWR
jgi:uncharacterized protein YjiS (DUF1127 family)